MGGGSVKRKTIFPVTFKCYENQISGSVAKSHWCLYSHICFWVIPDCSPATVAEPSGRDRDRVAADPQILSLPLRKTLPDPALQQWVQGALRGVLRALCPFGKPSVSLFSFSDFLCFFLSAVRHLNQAPLPTTASKTMVAYYGMSLVLGQMHDTACFFSMVTKLNFTLV